MAEAAPNNIIAYINTGPDKFNEARAVTTPPNTPIIPSAAPTLAVFCADNPLIPPIQHKLDAKNPI